MIIRTKTLILNWTLFPEYLIDALNSWQLLIQTSEATKEPALELVHLAVSAIQLKEMEKFTRVVTNINLYEYQALMLPQTNTRIHASISTTPSLGYLLWLH